jgi:kynureninase
MTRLDPENPMRSPAADPLNPHEDALLDYRQQFPILEKTNYLISNSLGAVPAEAELSLRQYYDTWASQGVRAWEESWWTMAADLGDMAAPLIGASAGEVVFQPNVTLAHAVVFSAFDFRARRTKIVTDAMHFPSILYLLAEQAKAGAEVVVVPSEDGVSISPERLIQSIDEQTAFVNISHVLFKSSYIQDVKAIATKARHVGALTIIDGYQAVGAIPVDVRSLGVDIYLGGCLKWLCGGPGAAFLWVDPQIRGRLTPRLTGWMAHQRPFAFEPSLARRDDAWRFLHGTPNIPALYAAAPGLRLINEIGVRDIRAKSIRQTKRLIERADEGGFRCTTPREDERRGGTVAIDVDHGYEISRALKARAILCDFRPGAGIRLSPHFYTADEELDSAISAIHEIRNSGEWKEHAATRSTVT